MRFIGDIRIMGIVGVVGRIGQVVQREMLLPCVDCLRECPGCKRNEIVIDSL